MLTNLLEYVGLIPRSYVIRRAPAVTPQDPRPSLPKDIPLVVNRPDVTIQDARGVLKTDLYEVTPQDSSVVLEYVTKPKVQATVNVAVPWTKYDEQCYAKYQMSTKSYTLAQYKKLRKLYVEQFEAIKTGAFKTADVEKATGMKKSWVEKRWPAVKQAMGKIEADLIAGRPLPYQ